MGETPRRRAPTRTKAVSSAKTKPAQPRTKRAQAERVVVAKASPSKTSPMSFRIDEATRDLVDRAASVSGQNRTDFMLMVLREKATEVLLNQRLFALNETHWSAFVAALDDPPPANAKLKALLALAPVWDR